ncbi:T9SS type A sorting domain-containing protein [bacterium]|nr:T9SS type A sorting domain-containing protein [bacterium]
MKRNLQITNNGTSNLDWNIRMNFQYGQTRAAKPLHQYRSSTFYSGVRVSSTAPRAFQKAITPTSGPTKLALARANSAAANGNERILVIQETDAWGVNIGDFIINNLGITPTVINSSQIAETDFFQYDLIVTAGDEDNTYYTELSNNVSKFEAYVIAGGVVQYQLATQGDNVTIVGGVQVIHSYAENVNRVLIPEHPIVSGLDSLLNGNSANHCYLTNLPGNAKVIVETADSRLPTLVEYSFGAGSVVATGMTWEYLYINGYNSGPMMGLALEYSLTLGGAWLRANPISGSIAASGNQQTTITIDASRLYPGDYEAAVEIVNNDVDPEDTVFVVPVTLTVLPPNMSASPDTFANIQYGLGDSTTVTLTVGNIGGQGRLLWSASVVSSSGIPVKFIPASGNLVQNGTEPVLIRLMPTFVAGTYDITIKVSGNDPANPNEEILIQATVLPPDVNVTSESIVKKVEKNKTGSSTLTISNTNAGKLFWNMSIQSDVPEEPTIQVNRSLKKGNNGKQSLLSKASHKSSSFSQLSSSQAFDFIPGTFDSLMLSETYLTCMTVDPATGLIYAQENGGYAFFQYDPSTNEWTQLEDCPIYSGNNGGAVVLNGKVYTTYTSGSGGSKAFREKAFDAFGEGPPPASGIGIYDIDSDTWTTMDSPTYSGLIETFGGKIYLADTYLFVSYDPMTLQWDTLPHPGELDPLFYDENTWGGLRYYNGYLYDLAGNGDTSFAKFDLATEEWTQLPAPPRGTVLGTAIDPVNHTFYAVGNYEDAGDSSLFAFNLNTEQWSVIGGLPFSYIDDMGMAYVPSGDYRGLYLIEGEAGYGFVRYNTTAGMGWLTASAYSGTINGNSSGNVTLNFMPDTLDIGDYTANIFITSNDADEPLITIPVTMQVRADVSGPVTGISFFQDKYLSQYIDVIATGNEPLSGSPVIKVTKPNASQETLTTVTVDAAKRVYYGHFKFDASGNYSFTVTSTDTASNSKDSVRTLSAVLAKVGSNASLASTDGVAIMKIADNTMKSDAYLTIAAEGADLYSSEGIYSLSEAYTFGPLGMDLNASATITFDYSKLSGVDENHLTIYRRTENGLEMMKTIVNKVSKTATTTTMKMGKYQLFYNGDVVSEFEGALPKEFALFQNYPNPFNPTTTIRYALPRETKVVVTVYNILGQEVKTLVNEIQAGGVKSVLWDGKNNAGQAVSSGIYLYRIQTKEFTSTRKMLFVK